MSTEHQLNANQAQMLLRMYTGEPELNHDTLNVSERRVLVELRRLGYRVPKGEGYGLTEEGTRRVNEMMGWPPSTVDPAAEEAKAWLRKAEMTHSGYQGEHDEGGAVFKIGGVPMSGPSVYDFGYGCHLSDQGISPQRTYAAFTEELMARWNRGPIRERKPPIIHDDQD